MIIGICCLILMYHNRKANAMLVPTLEHINEMGSHMRIPVRFELEKWEKKSMYALIHIGDDMPYGHFHSRIAAIRFMQTNAYCQFGTER